MDRGREGILTETAQHSNRTKHVAQAIPALYRSASLFSWPAVDASPRVSRAFLKAILSRACPASSIILDLLSVPSSLQQHMLSLLTSPPHPSIQSTSAQATIQPRLFAASDDQPWGDADNQTRLACAWHTNLVGCREWTILHPFVPSALRRGLTVTTWALDKSPPFATRGGQKRTES